jgi:hypothetical protein
MNALQPDRVMVYVEQSALQSGKDPQIVIGWEVKPFKLRGSEGEQE